jgi:hypothetical protein
LNPARRQKRQTAPFTSPTGTPTHGTKVRRRFGLEAAQLALGHSQANVAQVYAERDLGLAVKVAAKMG